MSLIRSTNRSARQIFTQAVELADPASRAAYLDEACGPDTELRREVEVLLNARLDVGLSPLDEMEAAFSPEQTVAPSDLAERSGDASAPRQIGSYKLLEQIGLGGMGAVYMAQQTTPVKRKVALKVIKPGMDSREVIARFEAERQALAMMDHPNIARVLDGGTTTEGRPYFVMELVRGVPLTDYCQEKRVGLEQRLQLFIHVCRAVQHAHHKGIIHRDLKPSNILVTLHDGVPVVKVIDFGVAKALNQELTERTLFTQFSQMIGTPLYMAPEQAEMSGLDIDTRSDIYSLGVILYELLTGTTPFDKESLAKLGFDGFRKVLREQDPPRPSIRISTLKAANLSTIEDKRRLATGVLSNKLKRELDWIVMKAMEKDRERRYESATALAADVQAYLNIEPVLACPPSVGYRLKKYLRRRRMVVSWSLAGVAALLVCGTLIAYFRYREVARIEGVRRQAELALRETETAIQAGDLPLAERALANAKTLVSPDRSAFAEVAAKVDALSVEVGQRQTDQARYEELLARAGDAQDRMTYGKHLKGDAAAELTLSTFFGVLDRDDWLRFMESTYLSPEQNARAKETIYETLLCLADHGPRWQGTAESAKRSLELLKRAEAFHPPSKALHWVRSECHRILDETEARDQALALFDATRPATALDHYLPGHTAGWRGDLNAAMEGYRAALRMQPDHYNSLFFLADRLQKEKRFAEAIAYFTGCLALRPNHVYALLGRGDAHEGLGDAKAAELDFRRAIEVDSLPEDRVHAFENLLEFYDRTRQYGKHEETLTLLYSQAERLIADRATDATPDDPESLRNLAALKNNLGRILGDAGRPSASVPLTEGALAVYKQLHGEEHRDTLIVKANLAQSYASTGRAEEALPLAREAFTKLEPLANVKDTLYAMRVLGNAHTKAGLWEKAIPFLEDARSRHIEVSGREDAQTLGVIYNLSLSYSGDGKPSQAVELLAGELETFKRVLGAEAELTLLAMNNLGSSLIDVGRSSEAIPILSEALDGTRRRYGQEHRETRVAMHNLGGAQLNAGHASAAVELFTELLEARSRLLGANHPESLETAAALMEAYRRAGRREALRDLALSHLKIVRSKSDDIALSSALATAAESLVLLEDFAEAEPLARECLRIREERFSGSWLHFNAQSLLGGALLGQKKYEEAEPLLLKAIEGLDRHREEIPESGRRHIEATIDRLVKLYESTDQAEKAARWNARLQELTKKTPPNSE